MLTTYTNSPQLSVGDSLPFSSLPSPIVFPELRAISSTVAVAEEFVLAFEKHAGQTKKTTVSGIPVWSPTTVLAERYHA
jgi:hypothetical protein